MAHQTNWAEFCGTIKSRYPVDLIFYAQQANNRQPFDHYYPHYLIA